MCVHVSPHRYLRRLTPHTSDRFGDIQIRAASGVIDYNVSVHIVSIVAEHMTVEACKRNLVALMVFQPDSMYDLCYVPGRYFSCVVRR